MYSDMRIIAGYSLNIMYAYMLTPNGLCVVYNAFYLFSCVQFSRCSLQLVNVTNLVNSVVFQVTMLAV